MKFWDASAIVPLLVQQPHTAAMQVLVAQDSAMAVWWGTYVECASALSRVARDGSLEDAATSLALDRLRMLSAAWIEIEATPPVRETAVRMLRVHPLRAADALQLSAAVVASGGQPSTLEMVVLDDRLATAARKEGFRVVDGTQDARSDR